MTASVKITMNHDVLPVTNKSSTLINMQDFNLVINEAVKEIAEIRLNWTLSVKLSIGRDR